jgi:hypothetical protein
MKFHPIVCVALACLAAGSKAEERNPPTTVPEVSLKQPAPFQGRRAIESPTQIPDMVPVRHPTRIPVRRIPMRKPSYPTTSPYPTVTPYPTPSTPAPTPTQNAGAAKPFQAAAAKPTFPPNYARRTTQLDQDMVLGTATSKSALPPPVHGRREAEVLGQYMVPVRHATKRPVMRPVGGGGDFTAYPTVTAFPTVATPVPTPSRNAGAATPVKLSIVVEPTFPPNYPRRTTQFEQNMVPIRHATKRPIRREASTYEPTGISENNPYYGITSDPTSRYATEKLTGAPVQGSQMRRA